MADDLRPPLTTRLRPGQWIAIDIGIALLLAVLVVVSIQGRRPAYGIPVWVGYALALLSALAVAGRRRWPTVVFAVVLAASTAAIGIGAAKDPAVPLLVALYTAGVLLPRRRSVVVLALAVAVSLAAAGFGPETLEGRTGSGAVVGRLVLAVVVVCASWVVGVAIREQRAYAVGLREQDARRAVTDDRLRIARELHDVVAHSMSVIAVRSAVANYVADTEPAEARQALADIEATSRGALAELRQMLGVLRADADQPEVALTPAPALADLDRLVAQAAQAGAVMELRIVGNSRRLPSGVEVSAYRIVQEALTNVVRHAAPARGTVLVGYGDRELSIEVTDDGSGRDGRLGVGRLVDGALGDGASGHGLIGIRERVALYGGELEAGPLPGRGFQVRARIPIAGGQP